MGKELNEKIFTLSPNIFDKTKGYDGYYVNTANGGRYNTSNWKCTGGGVCVLREFPSGCGAHSAVDETGCPMMSATPLYGSEMTVPVGIVEAVEWFMEWS